jgi:hypothetical protein
MVILSLKRIVLSAMLLAVLVSFGVLIASPVSAQPGEIPVEISLMSGAQGVIDNDSVIRDNFVNISVALSAARRRSFISERNRSQGK